MKSVRCAECRKIMKAKNVEIIFWRPGDQPIGLHPGCEAAYEGEDFYDEEAEPVDSTPWS